MLILCLDPRDCTSTTSWIDFLIAIWLLILVMIKTNGKIKKMEQVNQNWGNMSKDQASEARLAVYIIFYFPRNIIKNTCIIFFSPQSGVLNKSIKHVVFITMCMDVAKEHIFIYRWNIFFFTFSPIYFLIMFLTWHKILAKELNKFCNLVQLWYVIISMMSHYSVTVLKIQHTYKSWFRASEARLAVHVSLRTSPDEG